MSLSGKTALVTGAGRGIGRAAAAAIASRHASVALLARTKDQLEDAAAAIVSAGGRAEPIVCDVTDEQQVIRAFSRAEELLGPLDIVVNNAGTMTLKSIAETDLDTWRSILDVNLTGAFLVAREAMRRMSGRNRTPAGWIINVGSLAGRRGYPSQGAYCASKHGLAGLSKVLAIEGQAQGIRVVCIAPGGVMTDLSANLRVSRKADLSEWMTAEEVADAIVFAAEQSGVAMTDEIVLRRFHAEPWR